MLQVVLISKLRSIASQLVQVAIWADVPAAQQAFYALQTPVTKVPTASQAEAAAIQAGQVTEKVVSTEYDLDLPLAAIVQDLQQQAIAFQQTINNFRPAAKITRLVFDGTVWSTL